MSSRCRRQYFLAKENYGNKYVTKPKRVKIGLQQDPRQLLNSEDSVDNELPNDNCDGGCQSDNHSTCSLHKTSSLERQANTLHPVSFDSPGMPNGKDETIKSTDKQPYHMDDSEPEDDIGTEIPIFTSRGLNDLFSSSMANKQFKCMSDLEYSEVLFMVMNFYIRHALTQSALEDLLKLLNVITGVKTFPETFSAFLAQIRMNPYNSYRVYFCTNCHLDFGKDKPKPNMKCPICGSNENDFFLVIPIEQQIREMVTQYNENIVQYAQTIEEEKIADINRGEYARQKLTGETRTVLTLSANTDGAAAYKCTTQKPLYPVFLTLNNLPPVDRFSKHNLIVNALWLSKGEPNTNLLFKYLCLELIELEKTGIIINGSVYSIMLLQVNLDSVARCKVQNLKQFNGNYGCTYCLHPGELKASGTSRCYPIKKQVAARQNNATRKQMDEMCMNGNEQFGILGKTVFTSLRAFDVISCFPPDYMHAVLLGVMKQVWTMWTESEFHKQPFYIGNSLKEVEKRLLSFRPPSSFARYPHQLKEFKKYKANEWEAILLHYIYPALKGILPQVYLDHIMLLSSSVFNLLSPKLNESTINACDKQLKRFETKYQTLYGKESMTYNVHLLRHLIQAVRNFGALYNFSLFAYESGNAMLLGFRTSKKKPVLQIERKYCINKMCHYTQLPSASPIQNWVKTLWTKEHTPLEFDSKTLFVSCDSVVYDDDVDERIFSVHSRCYKNGLNLCTRDICKGSNYDDSWIEINGSFYCITQILCDKNNLVYIVGQRAKTKKIFDNLYTCHLTEEMRVVKINDSVQQCIAMQIEHKQTVESFISKCKIRTQCD